MRGHTTVWLCVALVSGLFTAALLLPGIPAQATPGAELWANRYSGSGEDATVALAADPSAPRVYAAGWTRRKGEGVDALVMAYDTNDGHRIWTTRFDHHGKRSGVSAMTLDP